MNIATASMQTPKARSGSSDMPKKASPKAVRQLKPPFLDTESASSSTKPCRTPSSRSPKVTDRRSPISPVPERKRPSKISELESQISQLQEDLKKVKDELSLSESCKKEAQQVAEESKKQLLALSTKVHDTEKWLQAQSDSREAHLIEFKTASEEHNRTWVSELEIVRRQVLIDSGALVSAVSEVHQLKNQLEVVDELEEKQTKHAGSAETKLHNLKGNLAETLYLVEIMKRQLNECQQSEADAKALVGRTLQQLETAKETVEVLRRDDAKSVNACNSISSELDQSRARLKFLETLMDKLEIDISSSTVLVGDGTLEQGAGKAKNVEESDSIKLEIYTLKTEIALLRSQLQTAETKYHEEQIESTVKMRAAYELVEQMKSESTAREAELQTELEKKLSDIDELKANLMDKETELQGILEENEGLNLKLKKKLSNQIDNRHDIEHNALNECIAELNANLMDKETTLQSISEENEMVELEISKRASEYGKVTDQEAGGVESAKAVEIDALVKLGIVMEEADWSSRKAARLAELEAAQEANSEMEAEMRKLKVQSDQWRKAAEAAATMLAAENNGKFMERTVSLDNNYHSVEDSYTPYPEDRDDDLQKKKNGNMLKKIGVLWKKSHK